MNAWYFHNTKISIVSSYDEIPLSVWNRILLLKNASGIEFQYRAAFVLLFTSQSIRGIRNLFTKLKLYFFVTFQATRDELDELRLFTDFLNKKIAFSKNPIDGQSLDDFSAEVKFLHFRKYCTNDLSNTELCSIYKVNEKYAKVFSLFFYCVIEDIVNSFEEVFPKPSEGQKKNIEKVNVHAMYANMVHDIAGTCLNYDKVDNLPAIDVLFDASKRIVAARKQREELEKLKPNGRR